MDFPFPYCTALPYGADVLLDTPIERGPRRPAARAGVPSMLGSGVSPRLRDAIFTLVVM